MGPARYTRALTQRGRALYRLRASGPKRYTRALTQKGRALYRLREWVLQDTPGLLHREAGPCMEELGP